MKVVFTANARDDLEQRFDYSVEKFGLPVADQIFGRVDAFIHRTLADHPRIGRSHPSGVLESWVPRTPFFVIYRIEPALPSVPRTRGAEPLGGVILGGIARRSPHTRG